MHISKADSPYIAIKLITFFYYFLNNHLVQRYYQQNEIMKEWQCVLEKWFDTNKQNRYISVTLNTTLISRGINIELKLDYDKFSENGRNIYFLIQITHILLEIDFDRTYSNETGSLTYWRFGISKYDQ